MNFMNWKYMKYMNSKYPSQLQKLLKMLFQNTIIEKFQQRAVILEHPGSILYPGYEKSTRCFYFRGENWAVFKSFNSDIILTIYIMVGCSSRS